MPSGGDSAGYDLTNVDGGIVGGGITDLATRTQSTVVAQKKSQVAGNDVISTVFGSVFAGLPTGMPLPLAILTMMARAIIGVPEAVWGSVESLVADVPVLGDVAKLIQQFMDAFVSALTGASTTGSNPVDVVFAVLNQGLQLPIQIIDQLWASIAQLTAGQQAKQNSPGTVLGDDFSTVGVSGYTSIQGTLAVSNGYIQTPNFSMGYRNVSPASEQQGAQIVIEAHQQGWSGVGICSDVTASSYALLQVYSGFQGDAVRLLTGSSPTVAVVQAQTDFIATRLADTNTFDIWYEVATNTFHVLRNNQKVFDWVDSTNIVTHNSSHRKVLLVSNGEDNSEIGHRGPGIGKANFYVRT